MNQKVLINTLFEPAFYWEIHHHIDCISYAYYDFSTGDYCIIHLWMPWTGSEDYLLLCEFN